MEQGVKKISDHQTRSPASITLWSGSDPHVSIVIVLAVDRHHDPDWSPYTTVPQHCVFWQLGSIQQHEIIQQFELQYLVCWIRTTQDSPCSPHASKMIAPPWPWFLIDLDHSSLDTATSTVISSSQTKCAFIGQYIPGAIMKPIWVNHLSVIIMCKVFTTFPPHLPTTPIRFHLPNSLPSFTSPNDLSASPVCLTFLPQSLWICLKRTLNKRMNLIAGLFRLCYQRKTAALIMTFKAW